MLIKGMNIKKFNSKKTLAIITPFPHKGGELAVENAISRYSYLVAANLPEKQKVVIFSQLGEGSEKPFLVKENILVIPSYQINSVFVFHQLIKNIVRFGKINSFLVQFEFGIFGGKKAIPSFMVLLTLIRLLGKNVTFTFHQAVNSLNDLAGHLGLKKGSLKLGLLDELLRLFLIFTGIISSKIVVHDLLLKKTLLQFIKEEKIEVIPHGIKKMSLRGEKDILTCKKALGFKPEDKIVLSFGYCSWYKGTDRMVGLIKGNRDKNIKLLLAGGESPTLKGTRSYQKYFQGLVGSVKEYPNKIKMTGYVKDGDVDAVFSMAEVVVFPYRTRMSASGALSLALGYGKPVIFSEAFSNNFKDEDMETLMNKNGLQINDYTFDLGSEKAFTVALNRVLTSGKTVKNRFRSFGKEISASRSWQATSLKYLKVSMREEGLISASFGREFAYATK